MLARFSRIWEIRAAIWRLSCRADRAANQGLTNFCTLNARACAIAVPFPTQPAGAGDDYEPDLVLVNEDFVTGVTAHRKASACLP